jgi:sec-independent protein translocase protein TatB
MFDIGWSELLLIGIVALIAIGPKELPGALRTLGQWMGKVRRMASEFQSQFHEAMREAELADLKKEVDEMTAKAESYAAFDPIEDIRKDIESAVSPPPALDAPVMEPSPSQTVADAAPPAVEGPAPATPPAAETASTAAPADTAAPPTETAAAASPDAGRAA